MSELRQEIDETIALLYKLLKISKLDEVPEIENKLDEVEEQTKRILKKCDRIKKCKQ